MLSNERKLELFDGAMNWIWSRMAYFDKIEIEMALEEIGFTDAEIAEILADLFTEDIESEETKNV